MTNPRLLKAMVVAGGISLPLAGILVHSYNRAPAGYAAAYTVAGMWVLSLLLALCGLLLLVIRRTRFTGIVLAGSSVFLALGFVSGIQFSEMAGLVAWRNLPLQRFGPNQSADLVVYYRTGTTRAQMTQLEDTILYQPRKDGRGKEFKRGIRMYLHLSPSQAHGHDGFALGLDSSMGKEERDSLQSSLAGSPYVLRVYRDVAPSKVPYAGQPE